MTMNKAHISDQGGSSRTDKTPAYGALPLKQNKGACCIPVLDPVEGDGCRFFTVLKNDWCWRVPLVLEHLEGDGWHHY